MTGSVDEGYWGGREQQSNRKDTGGGALVQGQWEEAKAQNGDTAEDEVRAAEELSESTELEVHVEEFRDSQLPDKIKATEEFPV